MSQENVERIQQVFDAFNRRDVDALLALTDEDFEGGSRLVPLEGRYRGHEGVLRWQQSLYDVFPDWHGEPLEVRDFNHFEHEPTP